MGLKRIAEGATAEVFALADGKVVKLYRAGYPPDEAEREAQKALLAHQQGLPTPQVVEVVETEGRQGIVFEECRGPTMAGRLYRQPDDAEPMGRILADLHAEVHACSGVGLPTTAQRIRCKIERAEPLSDERKAQLQSRLCTMATGEGMCHGDFHPGNVLLTRGGPMIIDWVDATRGPAVADVVRTDLLVRLGEDPSIPEESGTHRELRTRFLQAYHTQYRARRCVPDRDPQLWEPIIAGARLSEHLGSGAARDALMALAGRD